MKKMVIALCCFLCVISRLKPQDTDEDSYILENISPAFIGFYLPLNFIDSLINTKHYAASRDLNRNRKYYEYMVVEHNSMRYQYPMTDECREISKKELGNYQFINSAGEFIIVDGYGYRYKKIAADSENTDITVNNFIGNIVLNKLIKNEKIILEGNIITVPSLGNKKFRIDTWRTWYDEGSNLILYDFDLRWSVHLGINNNEYIIYRAIERNTGQTTKHVIWKTEHE